MSETKLFFIRDGKERGEATKLGPARFYLRCWFVSAADNEHAWKIMTNFYRCELENTRYFGIAAQPRSPETSDKTDPLPVKLTDGAEIAAWVSRIENLKVVHVDHETWAFEAASESEDADQPTLAGVLVQEVSVEMGFTEEEVEVGMERSLLLKLEE